MISKPAALAAIDGERVEAVAPEDDAYNLALDHARAAIEALPEDASVAKLWTCPDCAFGFDEGRTDEPGGGHSCPLCAEARLTKVVDAAKAFRSYFTGHPEGKCECMPCFYARAFDAALAELEGR